MQILSRAFQASVVVQKLFQVQVQFQPETMSEEDLLAFMNQMGLQTGFERIRRGRRGRNGRGWSDSRHPPRVQRAPAIPMYARKLLARGSDGSAADSSFRRRSRPLWERTKSARTTPAPAAPAKNTKSAAETSKRKEKPLSLRAAFLLENWYIRQPNRAGF